MNRTSVVLVLSFGILMSANGFSQSIGPDGRVARPMHPDWARSLRDQCKGAGVPFFFKQWGEWTPSNAECKPGEHTGGGLYLLPNGYAGNQGDWWTGTGLVFIAGGKTGKKARRHIPMSDRVRAMLLERAKLDSEWVFPSVKQSRAGKHMTAHGISSRFSEFKKEVGFPENLVLYSARHTFATDVTEATGNLTKTQKALGHTNLSTTARYNHTRSADIATIINVRNSQRHVLGHGTETVQ